MQRFIAFGAIRHITVEHLESLLTTGFILIITDLKGIITHLKKLIFFTSKRFSHIACGFNHRSVNGNDDCAMKGIRVKLRAKLISETFIG